MKISVSTLATAPREIAYATNLDIANWPAFIPGIDHTELLTEGPIREGTRFRETRTAFGRQASEEMMIQELRPPHSQVFTASSGGVRYIASTSFEVEGVDGTRLTLVFEGVPTTFATKLAAPLFVFLRRSIRAKLLADIEAVARETERRAAANAGLDRSAL